MPMWKYVQNQKQVSQTYKEIMSSYGIENQKNAIFWQNRCLSDSIIL